MASLPMDTYGSTPLDEGYSEAPLSVGSNGSGTAMMPPWLAQMPAQQRTQYIMSVMDTLPTADVCEIVRRLRPRLYINFFQHLPPEVCLKVLGLLDPISLLNTARASREWMSLALDRKLWEHLYHLEGFRVIASEVKKFEYEINLGLPNTFRENALKGKAPIAISATGPDGDSEMPDAASPPSQLQSIFGGTISNGMVSTPIINKGKGIAVDLSEDEIMADAPLRERTSPTLPMTFSLAIADRGSSQKALNWQYLYTQRRRLEANWELGRFKNFQLPHPDHIEERHKECIYTIQHVGKYLVSGSRDQTLRVWNIETQRLVHPPLVAHKGSVLCVQFDADPEEDLIVSGSSDATICLWRFSTGQLIHRMKKAHQESVLNVRFDKNVLVTCSKDKTIKVFNRRPLHPGDRGYSMADFISPVPTFLSNFGFNPSPTADLSIKPPYQIIARLDGHGAAVNAVQIHDDVVVSASGDRSIKLWNWPDQTCLRTFIGHTKGIACVQYDGRRIVSGSSDNEVKVFDKVTGLEVASLRGHSDLVRTVQAGFGDLPYSMQEDKEAARAVDYEYFKAVDAGEVSRTQAIPRGRPRNAGSRKPKDITSYGAQLPPGGGGGRFGRIVSGSYDGNVKIWRRDKEGVWKAQHTLKQEEGAVAAFSTRLRRLRGNPTTPALVATPAPASQGSASQSTAGPSLQARPSSVSSEGESLPPPGSQAYFHHLISTTVPQGTHALRAVLQTYPQLIESSHLLATVSNLPAPQRARMTLVISNVANGQGSTQPPTPVPALQSSPLPTSTPAGSQNAAAAETSAWNSSLVPTPVSTSVPVPAPTPVPAAAQAQAAAQASAKAQSMSQSAATAGPTVAAAAAAPAPAAAPHHHHHHHHRAQPENYRVFKLQFDARRIISCSQTPIIVGWDFANGDKKIIEASRFFAPIE